MLDPIVLREDATGAVGVERFTTAHLSANVQTGNNTKKSVGHQNLRVHLQQGHERKKERKKREDANEFLCPQSCGEN